MIITRTPFRVSFAGGGSDLKEYYREHGGAVLSVAIDKYVYLSMHPYFNKQQFFLKYSKNELADSVDDIQHRIIRTVLKLYNIKGVDFNSSADIPAGTGLGSSSAFTSGLITLCNTFTSKYMNQHDIAELACDIEINMLEEPIGKQDQFACAVGGLNFIQFNQDETVSVEKIILGKGKLQALESNLLMFYLGGTRSASNILQEQRENTLSQQKKIASIHRMVDLSKELKQELYGGHIDSIGDILHAGWNYKKKLASQISNEKIDGYYNRAINNGAKGGKLLGAGGCGFLLFYVPLEEQEKLRHALSDLHELDFKFDNEGTKVIYYND